MVAVAPEPQDEDGPDVELWDGEPVVKGQPSTWHEAVRAALLAQLVPQVPSGCVVVTSATVGTEATSPRSDGASIWPGTGVVPLWIEVLSPSDLRIADARLVGTRRRAWLFEHGVETVWALTDVLGRLTLSVLQRDGTAQAYAAPARPELTVKGPAGASPVVVDLGALEELGSRAVE